MDLGGFSEQAVEAVEQMLFGEQQKFIRPKGKKCPPGTRPKNKWCENPKPGKNFYLDSEGGCPPGTRAGGGFCKGEYAETPNPLEGQCGQKKKKQAAAKPRTPEQQKADRERGQEMKGQDNVPSGVRQQAAEKAAKTRQKCSGNKPPTQPSQPGPTG